ncbi:1,4-alpha-glucan branching protein [Sulfurifustis variabilis]|uniref:Malto-oligosyltrehalose trehalohydrolase n=2 Tax=Sulfurifustis variabilis TaxID=1675686 RepID=A0A1B4V654_9GAMM|nr:1,4-alpha-glucan branching protein [Sulfurifustis variabilis]
MPFGAELSEQGGARFRIWAPSARAVELGLARDGREEFLPLDRRDGGWYEGHVGVGPGARYRYRIDGGLVVPDPASRFQPDDVHGPSELIDPGAWEWTDRAWRGRPWDEAVLYELHVGSFTPEGTYAGVQGRLDHLKAVGVTAIELMPLADFPGARNWGYDGVLPFAPDSRYGRPEDLKALVQAAHAKNLMVFLDVVYNHFGPEGNYLSAYAAPFFTERHHTPWGAAINFDGEDARTVRDYYVHNALYWLEEYHFDGLRFDAVHAIMDDSEPDILSEIAAAVARGPGRERLVHLVLENDANQSRYLARDDAGRPRFYTAQWNDDIHHALHVSATDETGGYYADYADAPLRHLGRCLAEGFAYQGDPSAFRDGEKRGEPSRDLPPTAFVNFLQNHDQIGNRAFGERITDLADTARVRALSAVFLLAPGVPLLFMGEEWAARQPFPFFCDFGPELARAVTEGRRKEFARFPAFSDPEARSRIPDPNDPATFGEAVLDWGALTNPEHAGWLAWHRELLAVRAREIVPRLPRLRPGAARFRVIEDRGLYVEWPLEEGATLVLCANLSAEPLALDGRPNGRELYVQSETDDGAMSGGRLGPWSVAWLLQPATA